MIRLSVLMAGCAMLAAGMVQAGKAPRIFVTSQDDASVSEIDPRIDRILRRIPTAQGPAGIGSDAAGGRIAVTHPDAKAIDIVDVATGKVRRLPYEGEAFGVVIEGDSIYVSDWSRDRLVRLDAEIGRVTGFVPVGRSPAGLVIDRRLGRLYVANRESGGISAVDLKAMRVIADVETGTAPFALATAPDGRRLYVANVRSNDLAVVDTERLTRIETIKAGAMPYGVVVTADNRTILVTNQHGNTLSIVDAARSSVVATIPVGRYPEGVIAVGDRAYVANWFSGDVSVIDVVGRRELTRIKVGDGPRNFAMSDGLGPN